MKLTEKKREAIIEAAIAEFQAHGFSGAKTTRIAKRAAVSSRTLYNHFESKEVLFQAISRILIERKATMEFVPYDPKQELSAQLIAVVEAYIDVLTEPDAIALNRLVNAELFRDLERSRAYFAELGSYDLPIRQLIAEAMEAGALRKADPVFAAKQLIGLVKEFHYWPELLIGQHDETEGVIEDCVKMFLSYYQP